MSGSYKIINDDNETFQVFCDFDSEPGFAWNLIQSFSLSNKDLMRVTYNSEIGSVWCSAVIYLSLPHFCPISYFYFILAFYVFSSRLKIGFLTVSLLLTEREGRTEKYWPEIVTVRTKTTEGHAIFPVKTNIS